MSPNCSSSTKVASPWTWFRHKDKPAGRLHYQSEPVPGVYLDNSDGRYLVAMRPLRKREDNKLFKTEIAFNKHETQLYTQHSPTATSPLDCPWSINLDGTEPVITAVCETHSLHTTATADKSTVDLPSRSVKFVLPTFTPGPDANHITRRPYRKSPLYQCQNASDEPEDVMIHDLKHRQSRIMKHKEKSQVLPIDIVGFRHLNQPVQVEYSPVLQRWMFATELRQRTAIYLICAGETCSHDMDDKCGKAKVAKEFTCLDDGLTWLLTGDVGKNDKVEKRKDVSRDSSPLFAMVGPKMVTRLGKTEAEKRRANIEICEGKFLGWQEEPEEYVAVVKYLSRMPRTAAENLDMGV